MRHSFATRAINDFNSIKVRLELKALGKRVLILQFQFHKGAIRTMRFDFSKIDPRTFQFHKGAIRTIIALMIKWYLV